MSKDRHDDKRKKGDTMKPKKTILRRAAALLCCAALFGTSGCAPKSTDNFMSGISDFADSISSRVSSAETSYGSGEIGVDPTLFRANGFVAPLKDIYKLNESEDPAENTTQIPQADKYIALTFDDGPTGGSDGRTAQLLDGLKERGAHATFFICGYRVKDFHTVIKRYLPEGHEVGNHTMDHARLDQQADGGYYQVSSNADLIESYIGAKPTVMRPVGGYYNANTKSAMAQLDMPIILWDLDTLDWKIRDAENVKNNIINGAKDGTIVLMHDLYESTIDGVLAAMDVLQEQGYAFVTVSELAQIKGTELEGGSVYSDFISSEPTPKKVRPDSPPPRNPETYAAMTAA